VIQEEYGRSVNIPHRSTVQKLAEQKRDSWRVKLAAFQSPTLAGLRQKVAAREMA